MLSSHPINFPIALRTNARYFKVYNFQLQMWKAVSSRLANALCYNFSGCEIVSMLKWCLITQTFWRVGHGKVFAANSSHVELLYFSVLEKFLWLKCFLLFKTCSNPELFASVSDYSLVWGLNVLLPENYLFFSGMVIRYIIMRIPTCLRRKGFIRFLQSFAKYIWNLLGFTENLDF